MNKTMVADSIVYATDGNPAQLEVSVDGSNWLPIPRSD